MKSMTGYGKALLERNKKQIQVEVKSVNHKFLDVTFKMPRIFYFAEDAMKKTVAKFLIRGHVEVYVNYLDLSDEVKPINLDLGLAKSYIDSASELNKSFGVENDLTASRLIRFPDVIKSLQTENDEEELLSLVNDCLSEALTKLNEMRDKEGSNLQKDLLNKIKTVEESVEIIKEFAPKVVENYREKLQERMKEILGEVEIDENMLLNEVAFFTDKANIDEELTRLGSHIKQFKELCNSSNPSGRSLDFLMQEFFREANTICSKSNDIGVTNEALKLKNEIEKIREQVQNCE